MTYVSRALILGLLLATGCAAGSDAADDPDSLGDANDRRDELREEDDLEALAFQRPRVPYGRLPDGYNAIHTKLDSLPSYVRQDYYDHPLTEIASTSDGVPYQFYAGPQGTGVIYAVNGGRAVYGRILEGYAREGYEHGALGFPTADQGDSPYGGTQQAFAVENYQVGLYSDCLIKLTRLLSYSGNGPAYPREDRKYLVSATPGVLSDYPQPLDIDDGWYPQGSIQAEVVPYGFKTYWCGEEPAPWELPGYEPPDEIDP
jgi:hypothetical protein